MSTPRFAALALLVAALAAGCGNKNNPDQAAPAGSGAAAQASGPVTVDPEVLKRIKDIVANCTVDEASLSVSSCKGDQEYAPLNYAAEKKIGNFFESIGEIALTDGAKDKKIFAAVVSTWNTFSDQELQKKNSTPAAADRVIKLVDLVPDDVDRFGYAAAVALLAGQRERLTAALAKKKPGSRFRASMYNWYLDYGGVAALPDVQAFFAKATTDDERYSAAWSVGVANYGTRKVADADKAKMCDWAKSLLDDTHPRAFDGAAASLGRCKGPYIDADLTAVEARIAKGKITESLANALKDTCWRESMAVNGTKDQCARALGILEKALGDKDAPAGGVRQGLWAASVIGKYGDGQAPKAKQILAKFTGNKDKTIADAAKNGLKDLK
jgi:hypothetical protein